MAITAQNLLVLGTGNNTYNVTPFIMAPTYKVDDSPLGDSWQDSNWLSHTEVVRYKAKGSCTVWFDDPNDFEAFSSFIETNKGADEFIKATLYLNKKRAQKSNIDIMIQWEPVNDLPFYGVKQHDGYELTIEER